MTAALRFCRPITGKRTASSLLSCLVLFILATISPLPGQTNVAPPPANSAAATASAPKPEEDFGQYLADHQQDLEPFFQKNGADLMAQGMPWLLGWLGTVLLLALLAGWVADIFLGRAFSSFFAPGYARLPRAFVYATGRLVLSLLLSVLMGLAFSMSAGLHSQLAFAGIALASLLVIVAVQVGWVIYLYRTAFGAALGFYAVVLVVHTILGILISAPMIGGHASSLATDFVDRAITPKLRAEVDAARADLATVGGVRDKARTDVADAQNGITQALADEDRLRNEIEEKKNSDAYVFSQIMKVRAGGNLASTRDRLSQFLVEFPSGTLNTLAQAQLAEVNNEIGAQAAQKKQAEADEVKAEALARADLLARAQKEGVTLSEMRRVLVGKSRAEVKALFGVPTETGSDRWGFGQPMIINPLTEEKRGLAVYFADGSVQGVDYYYGKEPPK